MQTRRMSGTFKPHEIHNINTETAPCTNLEEYYYYNNNDYAHQDDMYAQNYYEQNFVHDNQHDQNCYNEIDDNENFRLNASLNQLDT